MASSAPWERLKLSGRMDQWLHLPLRYEDETRVVPIGHLKIGVPAQIEGVISDLSFRRTPRPNFIVSLEDDTGSLQLRFLHVYASLTKSMQVGVRLRVYGEVRYSFLGMEMVHPRYRVVLGQESLPRYLTPVYPTVNGVSQKVLQNAMRSILVGIEHSPLVAETVPTDAILELGLPSLVEAIRFLHYPPGDVSMVDLVERVHPAWRRIQFEELLAQQLSLQTSYRLHASLKAPLISQSEDSGALSKRLLEQLPFRLTVAQRRVIEEITADLNQHKPMRRLLQGDVGSGKTIVAALSICHILDAGYQAVLMAPTEVLAEQHFRKLDSWFGPLGIMVAWLSGSLKKREKQIQYARLASGDVRLVVGTHALFQDSVSFARLGLVIIDEQHRFGVSQRLSLMDKMSNSGGEGMPHHLMMSATPIPRTLAMAYHTDLDISIIDELPPGRSPIRTRLFSEERRQQIVEAVGESCVGGQQVYWVCPLIQESEKMLDQDLRSVTETVEYLQGLLPHLRIALLHGHLETREKSRIIEEFTKGEIHILVATTVIEVGVDVPNACTMVIEHAERFGLAQLHQLRGRVGRGSVASQCILLYQEPLTEEARERLKILYRHHDGFAIAEADLRLRGPGQFLGANQSGIPWMRFADPLRDAQLVQQAVKYARLMLEQNDPNIAPHLKRWGMEDNSTLLRT